MGTLFGRNVSDALVKRLLKNKREFFGMCELRKRGAAGNVSQQGQRSSSTVTCTMWMNIDVLSLS